MPDTAGERSAYVAAGHQLIEVLSERQRVVIHGYAASGATYDSVGQQAGCSRGTVVNDLRRIGGLIEALAGELDLDREELAGEVVHLLEIGATPPVSGG